MKMMSLFISRNLIVAGLICLLQTGCASFPSKTLPNYTYDQIHPQNPKPSIDYDAQFISLEKENTPAGKIFQEEIDKVFSESQFFSKFGPGAGTEKYHISFLVRNEGSPPLPIAFLNGFISGFTFGIIPAYAKDIFILSVDVKRDNQVVKHYEYRDSMETWLEIVLIVMTPSHPPNKVAREVYDGMIMNFLHDLEKDHLLIEVNNDSPANQLSMQNLP